jgi:hypothetical protein
MFLLKVVLFPFLLFILCNCDQDMNEAEPVLQTTPTSHPEPDIRLINSEIDLRHKTPEEERLHLNSTNSEIIPQSLGNR